MQIVVTRAISIKSLNVHNKEYTWHWKMVCKCIETNFVTPASFEMENNLSKLSPTININIHMPKTITKKHLYNSETSYHKKWFPQCSTNCYFHDPHTYKFISYAQFNLSYFLHQWFENRYSTTIIGHMMNQSPCCTWRNYTMYKTITLH